MGRLSHFNLESGLIVPPQGCIKLPWVHVGWVVIGFLGLTFQMATGLVIRWMPRQGLERFSSIQSAEVPWRLGRPLAQTCLNALDKRRKIPRTQTALG